VRCELPGLPARYRGREFIIDPETDGRRVLTDLREVAGRSEEPKAELADLDRAVANQNRLRFRYADVPSYLIREECDARNY
jgi:hypothetical protein